MKRTNTKRFYNREESFRPLTIENEFLMGFFNKRIVNNMKMQTKIEPLIINKTNMFISKLEKKKFSNNKTPNIKNNIRFSEFSTNTSRPIDKCVFPPYHSLKTAWM